MGWLLEMHHKVGEGTSKGQRAIDPEGTTSPVSPEGAIYGSSGHRPGDVVPQIGEALKGRPDVLATGYPRRTGPPLRGLWGCGASVSQGDALG